MIAGTTLRSGSQYFIEACSVNTHTHTHTYINGWKLHFPSCVIHGLMHRSNLRAFAELEVVSKEYVRVFLTQGFDWLTGLNWKLCPSLKSQNPNPNPNPYIRENIVTSSGWNCEYGDILAPWSKRFHLIRTFWPSNLNIKRHPQVPFKRAFDFCCEVCN